MTLPYPVVFSVSSVGLILAGILIWVISGSFTAGLVVLTLAGIIFYIYTTFGETTIKQTDKGLDVEQIPNANTGPSIGAGIKEVFHISDNMYSYDEAPAVCAAYGAELATYDQVLDAQIQGAEWCGYGWSATGMALYPTSQATWEALQKEQKETKRTACGHPGVNGGYFDPRMKFGVNCYGRKPPNMGTRLPQPLPGSENTQEFDKQVNKFKSMLTSMKLSPFNRDVWSKIGSYMPSFPTFSYPQAPTENRTVPMTPAPAKNPVVPQAPTKSEPASYEDYSKNICTEFGICDYKNDEEAAHREAPNATDAEAADKAAGDTGPMSI
jgi:hypothetical protein